MPFEVVNTPESTATFVQNRWEYFRDWGDQLLDLAINGAFDLANPVSSYTPYTLNVTLDVDPEYGTFVRPAAPTPPTFEDVDLTVPTAPAVGVIATPTLEAAPVAPDITPYIGFSLPGSEPTAPTVPSGLDDDVALDEVTLPAYVEPDLPTLGDLYVIELPDVPDVSIEAFSATRPSFDVDAPDNTFSFTNEDYTSSLITSMQAKLAEVLTGGTGLPAVVENSLFEQARSRDSRAAHRLRTAVADEMAARGLSEPTGLLPRRLLEIEQDVQDKGNAVSREILIQRYQQEIEQFRFAIQQGAALEGVLIQQQIATNDRRLRAAQIAVEVAISLFNARVTQFNAEVQAYATDAQVFRDKIQAELAKVELYKAQIDGQKAIGELNETLVRAYSEQVRAVVSLAELYKTKVEAARVQIELNTQRLEAKRVQVQTYGERVRAYGVEWDGYKAQVEGRLGAMRAGELLLGMYGQSVQAWSTKANGTFEGARLLFAGEQLKNQQYLAVLEAARAQLAVQVATTEARARAFEAETRAYEAQGRMIESEAQVRNTVATSKIALAEAQANVQFKNAEFQVTQAAKLIDLEISANSGKTQVLSQLGASVLSGFNFGAQLSGSTSSSINQSRSASVSYSAGGPDITFAIGAI